jgi:hypothetical protein
MREHKPKVARFFAMTRMALGANDEMRTIFSMLELTMIILVSGHRFPEDGCIEFPR